MILLLKRITFWTSLFFLCLMLPLSIFAIEPLSVTFGTQKLSGFSTYSIGGITDSKFGKIVYHFPVSELQFPTNVSVVVGNVIVWLILVFLHNLPNDF